MAVLKIFAGVTTVLAILTSLFSTWLLASALMEDCAGQGYSYSLQYSNAFRPRQMYDRTYAGYFGDSYRDRGYDSRYETRHHYARSQNREYFCYEFVANWITAAAIGLSVGVLQMVLSVFYLVRSESRPLTLIWCTGHLLLIAALIASLIISIQGDVHDSYEIETVGKIFLGIIILNIAICFLLPCCGCWIAWQGGSGGGGEEEGGSERERRYKQQQGGY